MNLLLGDSLDAITADALPPMIMVWVNGPALSFYTDSPDGRVPAEAVFVTELVPHIDATYRTSADPRGRAVEGMSMGGFGALTLAMKHVDLFGSVVAYAPALVEVQRRDDGLLTLARAGGTHEGARMPRVGIPGHRERGFRSKVNKESKAS